MNETLIKEKIPKLYSKEGSNVLLYECLAFLLNRGQARYFVKQINKNLYKKMTQTHFHQLNHFRPTVRKYKLTKEFL